jgi:hypothetical protein
MPGETSPTLTEEYPTYDGLAREESLRSEIIQNAETLADIDETAEPIQQPRSASDIINESLSSTRSTSAEIEPTPDADKFSIEDYVDSQENLKNNRRQTARIYLRMKEQESRKMPDQPEFDRASATKERPDWDAHFPKDDTPEEMARWKEFVSSFPDKILQRSLEGLQRASSKYEEIASSPKIQEQISEYKAERMEVFAKVAAYRYLERREKAINAEIEALDATATSSGETDWADKDTIRTLIDELDHASRAKDTILRSGAEISELERRIVLDKKRQLDEGVLMTDQMSDVEKKNINSLLTGKPILIVGETGGAKTGLAKHMAAEILRRLGRPDEIPEFVSGSGELNTYQLMGKTDLSDEGGNSVTNFAEGPMVRAMREGRPIIIDEVNSIDGNLLKRLNEILLKRPGDTYQIQEDNGMEVTIAPGFCIIATMNEKSHRYKGVDSLGADFIDRVNRANIKYPDQDTPVGAENIPPDLMLLATLTLTDKMGKLNLANITPDELVKFVQVAHYTQMMFTRPASDRSFESYVNSGQIADSTQTALEKAVISPRNMVKIIEQIRDGKGTISLEYILTQFLGSVEVPNDKKIMTTLFEEFDLIPKPKPQ